MASAAVERRDHGNSNRYSYVLNNPLTFIDPSGFDCWVPLVPVPLGPARAAHDDALVGRAALWEANRVSVKIERGTPSRLASSMTLARGTDRIDSERLVLRRINPEDLGFLTRLHADPEVSRYLGDGRCRSPQESLAWLQTTIETYENFELGQLAVLRKADGAVIGRCGLSYLAVEARVSTGVRPRAWYQGQIPVDIELLFERELGYTFERSFWGNGYAGEAARCVFDYACDALKLRRVISIIHPENARSLRVAEKYGLRHEDTLEVMGHARDRYVWPTRC